MGFGKLLDKIKINKFVEAGLAYATCNLFFASNESAITEGIIKVSSILLVGVSAGIAKIQNLRYDRLVNEINKSGYDERICSLYMNSPCGRSLVKTVLKRTDNFDNYPKLKEKYPITSMLD
ncbi:MAG: hypothetical protein ABIH65_01120 [Nanoarchaeota archaeon]